jgi:hypothetical protein
MFQAHWNLWIMVADKDPIKAIDQDTTAGCSTVKLLGHHAVEPRSWTTTMLCIHQSMQPPINTTTNQRNH